VDYAHVFRGCLSAYYAPRYAVSCENTPAYYALIGALVQLITESLRPVVGKAHPEIGIHTDEIPWITHTYCLKTAAAVYALATAVEHALPAYQHAVEQALPHLPVSTEAPFGEEVSH
jgi:hypothetical protein